MTRVAFSLSQSVKTRLPSFPIAPPVLYLLYKQRRSRGRRLSTRRIDRQPAGLSDTSSTTLPLPTTVLSLSLHLYLSPTLPLVPLPTAITNAHTRARTLSLAHAFGVPQCSAPILHVTRERRRPIDATTVRAKRKALSTLKDLELRTPSILRLGWGHG